MRAFFIALSESKSLRAFAERSRAGQKVSHRFVAGMTVDDALAATTATNANGMSVSIDNLGENVTNLEEAKHSAALYHEMLDRIAERKLDANVSMKLTHMGLDVDEALARSITNELVAHAARLNSFVRIDMEGSAYTEKTLQIVRELHQTPANAGRVGAVIQAYLRRSESDVEKLCAERIRIRLCKGAYKEPAEIAWTKMDDIRASYRRCAHLLLEKGNYPAIATHDESLVRHALSFTRERGIGKERFEFQMLYGLRPGRWDELVRAGHNMRVYVPYGSHWFPYFYRRLRERKENVFFVLRSLLGG